MIKVEYNVVAVMSGTSLDGIDIIYVTFSRSRNWNFKIHHAKTIKYSAKWKALLANLVNKSLGELKALDIAYSKYLASEILSFINKFNIRGIDFVSSHGHTALHQPEKGLTYQIGNHQVFAEVLQQKIICDFRVQDVEYGGQGAPLVPVGDMLLFHNYEYCLNLGGFANVSFEKNNERVAFDICPVNIVLNHYVSKLNLEYDNRGKIASTGKVNNDLLAELNQLEFYNQLPPKSLGLEWVKSLVFPLIDRYNLSVEGILRTFIEHIAIQISKVLENQSSKILITGGGVYNDFLIQRLKEKTASNIVVPDNEIVEFKEALVFGLLGVLKERNEINCLKSVTGATRDHSSGKILFPNA